MTLVQTLFSFKGRLRRRDWWLWSIASSIGYAIVYLTCARLLFPGSNFASLEWQPVIGDPIAPLLLGVVTTAPFAWIHCALAVKRAHDRNQPAALVVVLHIGGVVSSFLPVDPTQLESFRSPDTTLVIMAVFSLLMLAASFYLLVVLGFLDGTRGPNRFGRSPKGIGHDLPNETAKVFD